MLHLYARSENEPLADTRFGFLKKSVHFVWTVGALEKLNVECESKKPKE